VSASWFSGPFVGLAGSRVQPYWFEPAVSEVVGDVLSSGRGVAVGCQAGADAQVRDAWCSTFDGVPWEVPPILVFSWRFYPASSFVGSLARRSVALVRFVASSGPGAEFVAFPSVPCPAGLVPDSRPERCFTGYGNGTWAACALAAGLGLPVSVSRLWDSGEHPPLPAWPGGSWRSSVYDSLWVPESVAQGGLWD
jgi:hypothetical protein